MLTSMTGINWGDEGKGRMVDYLTQQYDVVVRYQGGGNAVVQPKLCRCCGIRFLRGRIFAQIAHCILNSLAYNTLRARKNAPKSFHLDEQGGCSHACDEYRHADRNEADR